ncbi:hypothetical protein [Pantoea stewartii]|uniref:hypothetical protein n=2 Tax=Pantoea stewartii TaxID=66269 RepID=UPI00209CC66E|nr:hypothetical protein [Pantoea stewartii]
MNSHHQKEGTRMISGRAERQEPGRYYTFESRLPPGEFFELRPQHLPRNAQPVLDETSGMCIGYTVAQAPGLWQIYDAQGHFVRLEEAPLETPLFDPTDIALIAFGVFRILRTGRALFEAGTRTAITAKLGQGTISFLRARFKLGLSVRNLKMTEMAAKHMYETGRYVPLHIQEKAIRFGKRTADPRKVKGLYRYEIEMYKLYRKKATTEYKKYTLEVVVRESDWTITHFMYF